MKKVLITGANGQLGSSIRQKIIENKIENYAFSFIDSSKLDLMDKKAVEYFFKKYSFDYLINCAAYTAVDKAESESNFAMKLNADAVKYLAEVCKEQDSILYHISTDYVFSGEESSPRKELDPVAPLNIYGKTKLTGENYALQINPKTFVIRTSWLYSPYGSNFVKTMLRLFEEKAELGIINDQLGSPTNALDLAEVILNFIKSENTNYGIYHYSNEGECSWYEFAKEIKKLSGSSINLNPLLTSAYPTPAKRPKYSLLDKSKIKETLNIQVPRWEESLENIFSEIKINL